MLLLIETPIPVCRRWHVYLW